MIFAPAILISQASTVNPIMNSWRPLVPGNAVANGSIVSNSAISIQFGGPNLDSATVVDLYTGQTDALSMPAFSLIMRDGSVISSSTMTLKSGPVSTAVRAEKSLNLAKRTAGMKSTWQFIDPGTGATFDFSVLLRNGEDYIREFLTITPGQQQIDVASVQFLSCNLTKPLVDGSVLGSPIVDGNIYFGVEHPMSVSTVDGAMSTCKMDRKLPIDANQSVTYSFVVGVTPDGQLRRGFQNYVQEERARPYAPFLHYNSWLDLYPDKQYNETECLNRINAFGQELVKKRGVKMDSFLFDDGWDNYDGAWDFNSGFPNGFLPLKAAAAKYGAAPGVWLSPWGGYGDPRTERLANAKKLGLEEDDQGLALSGPKYYQLFHKVTMDFVTKYGVNQFKFDGTGSPDKKYPGSKFDSDFDAAISLIGDLRAARPGLFVNLTTGTWPSPFWLDYADSTWRGGYDSNFAGVGTKRQQWMTYRDGDTYEGVVQKGPLYPINSLMLHGIIYATYATGIKTDPGNDFRSDVRTYFATGTQLQEMYITPSLLTKQNWDDLAEAAKWSRRNASILKDAHWVGGDPMKSEVYGWADWSPNKSILSLRNPSDKPQTFTVDIAKLLEMPATNFASWSVTPAYPDQIGMTPASFPVGSTTDITLAPFETLIMELKPSK